MGFCEECGTELVDKYVENEGMIPFCPSCNKLRFPLFNVCVSMVVMNEALDRILLIKQYGGKSYLLVAGYVNKGEAPEATVVREISEELGLGVKRLIYNKGEYFAGTNTLMLNFGVMVDDMSLEHLNTQEIDAAQWFTFDEAVENIDADKTVKENSLARKFLLYHIEDIGKWRSSR